MPRPISMVTLAGALCCAIACEGSKPPAEDSPATAKPNQVAPAEPAPPTVVGELEGEPPPLVDPPWFDSAKIPHAAVIQQMASQGAIAGGQARAMILELEQGVSNEQCIDRAKAAIGESVSELPEAEVGDDGRLTLQGKTDDYHFTVVCGEAKGKPTMYLSYTR
jgi:hypothetical protein